MEASKTLQTATSMMRALTLLAIFGMAMIALFAEPNDDSARWLTLFFASKALAAAGFLTFWKLYTRWSKTDHWIKAYDESCHKAIETEGDCFIRKEE